MSYVGEARFRFDGPADLCSRYIPVARVLVERTMAMHDVGGSVDTAVQTQTLRDGTTIKVVVFAAAPPIITIIVAGGGEKTYLNGWLKICKNGLYIDESILEDTDTGHGTKGAEPYTKLLAVLTETSPDVYEWLVPLSDRRLDDTATYVSVPGTPTRGTHTIPVVSPYGGAIKSGRRGILCFTELGQAGFFWKMKLPTDPIDDPERWFRCYVRVRVEGDDSTYTDPPFTNPLTRNVDVSAISRSRNGPNYMRAIVDVFELRGGLDQTDAVHEFVYDIELNDTIDNPAGDSGEPIAPVVMSVGRCEMLEATATTLWLTFKDDYTTDFPATYAPDEGPATHTSQGESITLSSDGSYTQSNRYYWPRMNAPFPIGAYTRVTGMSRAAYPVWPFGSFTIYPDPNEPQLDKDLYGVGHVVWADHRLEDGGDTIPSGDVLSLGTIALLVSTTESSMANTATEFVLNHTYSFQVMYAGPGADIADTSESSGDMADGTYTSTVTRVNKFAPEISTLHAAERQIDYSYYALTERATRYGLCEVAVDVTNTAAHVRSQENFTSSNGSAQYRDDKDPEDPNDTPTFTGPSSFTSGDATFSRRADTRFTVTTDITINAFGHPHTLNVFQEMLEDFEDSSTRVIDEPNVTGAPDYTDSFTETTPRGFKSWVLTHGDETLDLSFMVWDTSYGSRTAQSHSPTGAVFAAENFRPISSLRYRPVEVHAHTEGGILWVEVRVTGIRVSAQHPRRVAEGETGTFFAHFSWLYAFTSAGEKIRVQPRTSEFTNPQFFPWDSLDPSGLDYPFEVAHNPETGQTFEVWEGEQYACFVHAAAPDEYTVKLPLGIEGDVLDPERINVEQQ